MKKTYQFDADLLKNCYDGCPIATVHLCTVPYDFCALALNVACDDEKRPADCPLKEVENPDSK